MLIEKIGPNMTVLKLNNGGEILFSYETPVAANIPGRGKIKTDRYFSRTTSRHISDWTHDQRPETVPHAEILKLTKEAR